MTRRKAITYVYVLLFLVTLGFSGVIICFSAINTTFSNPTRIYYIANKDISSGATLNRAIKGTNDYAVVNDSISRIVFDFYDSTEPLTYMENGENVIEGKTGVSLEWGDATIELYRVTNSDDTSSVYLLSNDQIVGSTNMTYAFYNFAAVKEIVFNNFSITSQTTNLAGMFRNCELLESVDVSKFDTSEVTDFSLMFSGCGSLTSLEVSDFDTSKATTMSNMFGGCSSLTELDVSNFKTSNVKDFGYMFINCRNLETIDVSGFDTTSATSLSQMFNNCKKSKNWTSIIL